MTGLLLEWPEQDCCFLTIQPCIDSQHSGALEKDGSSQHLGGLEQFWWWLSLTVWSAGSAGLDPVGWSTCLGLPASTDCGGSKAQLLQLFFWYWESNSWLCPCQAGAYAVELNPRPNYCNFDSSGHRQHYIRGLIHMGLRVVRFHFLTQSSLILRGVLHLPDLWASCFCA